MGLNGTLGTLVEEIERLLVQAEAEVYTRKLSLQEAEFDVKRLRTILKAAGADPDEPKAQPKRQPEPRKVNEETRAKVLAAIRRFEQGDTPRILDVPGSFCAKDIVGDFHESSARTAIHVLREEGVIRAVGTLSGPRRNPTVYARVGVDDV